MFDKLKDQAGDLAKNLADKAGDLAGDLAAHRLDCGVPADLCGLDL